MTIQVNFPFDTPANYVVANAVVAGGAATIVDERPTNALWGATYTSDIDGSFGGGDLSGTAVGGAAVAAGKLDLRDFGKYVDYDASGNAAGAVQTGAIKFKFTPDYTGKPVGQWNAFCSLANSSGSLLNRIDFLHSSSAGQIQLRLYSSTGSSIGTFTLANWIAVAGQEYEFEYNFDFDGGDHRVFIDGVLHDSFTATGTRSGDAGLLRIGADFNAGITSDSQYADVVVFDTVQHTANYTPGYTLPEADFAEGTVTPTALLQAEELTGFAATEDVADGTIRYAVEVGGQLRWWNGAAWADSDGTWSQLSSAADIEANKATLMASIQLIRFFARLQSADGTGTPALENVLVCYDFGAQPPGASTTCEVYGFLRDMGGNPVVGAFVTAETLREGVYVESDDVVVGGSVSATTDAEGRFDLKLIQGLEVRLAFAFPAERVFIVNDNPAQTIRLTVPALDFVDVTSLLP